MASGRLEGKIAIVTGAGSVGPGWGNGRSITARFAQEGAKVFAVDRAERAMDETLRLVGDTGEIATHVCDVTDSDAVRTLVETCAERFGGIDILVNNVGGPVRGGVTALEEDAWEAQIALNLTTVFRMCRRAVPHMERRGGGSIVNISSTSGIRWTGAAHVGYAAAKGGIVQYSRVAAVELAPQRIRVNSILPGQLHTPLVDATLAAQQASGDIEALLERRRKRIPLPFEGDGRDTANAALFLASDEARYITGTELVVDGGMSARCD